MSVRERLSNVQVVIMRSLFMRSGGMPVSLGARLRTYVVPLWRRELIQVWHRTSPERGAEGPYYSLTQTGQRLAQSLFDRAPRRSSGAEQHP